MEIIKYFKQNGFRVLMESEYAIYVSFKGKRHTVFIQDKPQPTDLGFIIYKNCEISDQVDFICDLIYLDWAEDNLIFLLNGNFYYKAYIFCANLHPLFYTGCRTEDLWARFQYLPDSFNFTILRKIQGVFIEAFFGYRKIIQEIDAVNSVLTEKLKNKMLIEFKGYLESLSKAFPPEIEEQIYKNFSKFVKNHYGKEVIFWLRGK